MFTTHSTVLKIILVILSGWLCFQANGQRLEIDPVQLSDPKDFGGRVNCILQDKTGFIWIGKETGLFRYDGNEMRSFRHDAADTTSIGGNNILTIIEDSSGNLWIGTKGGGLNYYHRASGRFRRYLHDDRNPRSVSYNEIQTIVPDGKGQYWIGTDGRGLDLFNPATGLFSNHKEPVGRPGGLQSNKVLKIIRAGRFSYWIGTWGGGLHYLDERSGQVTHMGDGTRFAKMNIYGIREVSPGILWLATWGHGLLAYDIKSGAFRVIIDPSRIPFFRDVLISADGALWVSSWKGLLHFSSPSAAYQQVAGSEKFVPVSRAYMDRTGMIWIGGDNGSIGKLNPLRKKFSVVPSSYPFAGSSVNAIYPDTASRQVYFATGKYLINYNPALRSYKTFVAAYPEIVSIAALPGSPLLLCASWTGLSFFNKTTGVFTRLSFTGQQAADLASRQIWSMALMDSATCWIGLSGAACRVRLDKEKRVCEIKEVIYSGTGGLLSIFHYPTVFWQDADQRLWAGTWGGGVSQRAGRSSRFTLYVHQEKNAASISDNFVESMAADRSGHIVAGTHAGLNYLNPETGQFRSLSTGDGLASDWIAGIISDRRKGLWISTRKGISFVTDNGRTIRNYDVNDGLPSNAFVPRSIAMDRAGYIYFGSAGGMVWFHPDSLSVNRLVPEAVPVRLKVNDEDVNAGQGTLEESIELAKEIHLKSAAATFSIQLAALSYFNPSKNRIRYRLEGFDTDWRLAAPGQVASYADVPPGQYRFIFTAANEDGVWNTREKTILVRIDGSPWRSGPALLLYFLVAAGFAVLVYYRWRLQPAAQAAQTNSGAKNRSANELIQPKKIEVAPADLQFLQKAVAVVEEHISDPDFKVDQFCDKMFMSRPQLYRKMQAVAGITLTDFIKEVRLKRAAQLILQKPGNISDIAYEVGFNDPKYFSKCFKQLFGVSPGQYKAPE